MSAARSTCNIGVKRHVTTDGKYASGTAFFVGPKTLLTAGHVVSDSKDIIIIEKPGILKATYFVEHLFQPTQSTIVQRYRCKLVDTLSRNADISVLQVLGDFTADNYLTVKQESLDDDCHYPVDILGYPAAYTDKQVQRMHPSEELVDGDMIHDIEALFPKRQLVITHGSIISGGNHPVYQLSTVGGMSGAPVVLNGNVIGESIHLSAMLTSLPGIHIGVEKYSSSNRCISFEWPLVWNLLKTCGITRKCPIEVDYLPVDEDDINGIEGGQPPKSFWKKGMPWMKKESDTDGAAEERLNSRQIRHKTHRPSQSLPSNIFPN